MNLSSDCFVKNLFLAQYFDSLCKDIKNGVSALLFSEIYSLSIDQESTLSPMEKLSCVPLCINQPNLRPTAVVKTQILFSSHGGFLFDAMFHHWETIKSN